MRCSWFSGLAGGLALALGLSGCAPALTPPERTWCEITSRHFTVTTDAKEERGRSVTRDFERSYAALRAFLRGADSPTKIQVFAIENVSDYQLIVSNERSVGAYRNQRTALGSRRLILFALDSSLSAQEVFQHELTHHFVRALYPNAPAWLNEGLALALSSVKLDDNRATFGAPLDKYRHDGWQWQWSLTPLADLQPDLGELRGITYDVFYMDHRGYAGAWTLAHVLLFGGPAYRTAFDGYLGRLAAGAAEPEAFSSSFPPEFVARLAKDYLSLPKREDLPTQELSVPMAAEGGERVRRLGASEAHAMWGSLRPNSATQRPLALEEADRAVALDPKAPAGYLLRATVRLASADEKTAYWNLRGEALEKRLENLPAEDKQAVLVDLRRAVALDRGGAGAARALGWVLLKFGDRTAEVAQIAARVAPVASDAQDFLFLATFEGTQKNYDRAIERAMEGVRRDAGCVGCYEAAAKAAAMAQNHELAVSLQQRAINVAAERATPEMFARLRRYATR